MAGCVGSFKMPAASGVSASASNGGALSRGLSVLRFDTAVICFAAYTTPDFTAQTAACVRSFTASFRSRFWTCSFTVSTLISRD